MLYMTTVAPDVFHDVSNANYDVAAARDPLVKTYLDARLKRDDPVMRETAVEMQRIALEGIRRAPFQVYGGVFRPGRV